MIGTGRYLFGAKEKWSSWARQRKENGPKKRGWFWKIFKTDFQQRFQNQIYVSNNFKGLQICWFVSLNENSKQRGRVYYKTIQGKIIK
jgi:hypothetical protein